MKVFGIIVGDKFLYSRARHDFRTTGEDGDVVGIDGGQPSSVSYVRVINPAKCKSAWVEVEDITKADLFNDFNNQTDELGICAVSDVKIIDDPKDFPDTESWEWNKQNMIWGTRGLDGKQGVKYKMLTDLETDQLEAILKTQFHIGDDYKRAIKEILEERGSI
jgi:hypothetical protein